MTIWLPILITAAMGATCLLIVTSTPKGERVPILATLLCLASVTYAWAAWFIWGV